MTAHSQMPHPGTSAYRQYGDWLIKHVETYTGPLYDLGNLSNPTLEKLYEQIVGKNPWLQYRLEHPKGGD